MTETVHCTQKNTVCLLKTKPVLRVDPTVGQPDYPRGPPEVDHCMMC